MLRAWRSGPLQTMLTPSPSAMPLALLLLQFLVCAALIGRAGYALSHSADRIARATGLTGGWVGLALLATVTSLPELASGISSVTLMDAPNLAVGNALGACVFNLAFLVAVDLLQQHQPIYRHASAAHLLSAAFGVVMLGFVAMSLLLAGRAPAVLHLGLYSPVLLALYLLALRSVYGHEQALRPAAGSAAAPAAPAPLGHEWRRFGLAAAVVLAAGSWLPVLADQLATQLGWSRSFAGTLLMALVTTLPEMAVTLGALRLGALDMAIGNLLGSNLFNTAILAVDDLFYTRGPLLAQAAPVHAGTAVAGAVMSGLVMVGLVMRPQGRVLRVLSWISVGLLATYVLNAAIVFVHGG
jgi:cation:H+ antiporter